MNWIALLKTIITIISITTGHFLVALWTHTPLGPALATLPYTLLGGTVVLLVIDHLMRRRRRRQ